LSFVDDWIIRWFGSYLQPASITWLSYGKTLMRVPLGLVGQAIGVASFPILAQLYSERKMHDLNRILNTTFKALIVLLLPMSALIIAQSEPLVYLAFSRTRLHGPDLTATASALAFFSLGLFAWGAQNILARGFYATRDTITPAVVGTLTTLMSLPIYWLLVRRLDYRGLALASTIGIITYTIILFALLGRRTRNPEQRGLVVFFVKVAAASCVAGYGCYKFAGWLENFIAWQHIGGALLLLVVVSAAGLLLLGILLKILRVPELDAYLRRAYSFVGRS
jgi:putative peptidoglycan lipid II flippase